MENLEHFAIIQALCRCALASGSTAAIHQVERLRDALQTAGDARSAGNLTRLLSEDARVGEMSPSRLKRSAAAVVSQGERLTPATLVPVDRETSSPLAQVVSVEALPEDAPVFGQTLTSALDALLSEWQHADVLLENGLTAPRSCLLYGAPGVGKTALALWMARQAELPVVLARLDGLVSSFLGTTARNIGALFAFAQRYRCLLLLDEFDAIAKLRDDPQEVGEIKRVVNALLQNLDQRSRYGLTIAITNHEALLDPAVWRRFEIQLKVPMPGFEQRLHIIDRYLVPVRLTLPQVKLIGWLTEGHSGADIEQVVRSVKRTMIVNQAHGVAFDLLHCLRQYLDLNPGRFDELRRRALTAEREQFVQLIRSDAKEIFSAKDLSSITSVPSSTMHRWLASASA